MHTEHNEIIYDAKHDESIDIGDIIGHANLLNTKKGFAIRVSGFSNIRRRRWG